jgi:hypothetical protein
MFLGNDEKPQLGLVFTWAPIIDEWGNHPQIEQKPGC